MTKLAKYLADDGQNYTIRVADWVDDVALTVSGLQVVGSTPDPVIPKGLKVRGVYLITASGSRRFLPCNVAGTAYTNSSTTFTALGEEARSTGRKGEQITFFADASIS